MVVHRQIGLSPPVKYFTDHSKAVLLLWIFYGVFLSCVCYAFLHVCLYVPCGHLLGKGWSLALVCGFLLSVCYFPIGILGQVWYLIVSIPDLCTLTYFVIANNAYPEEMPHFCQRIHLGGSAPRKSTIFPGHGWVKIIY